MDTASHDPHHAHDASGHGHHAPTDRPGGATLSASYIVAFLLAGLLIAAVNFIGVMSAGHHDEKGSIHQTQDATSSQTLHGEDGLGVDKANPTEYPATDSQHREGGQ